MKLMFFNDEFNGVYRFVKKNVLFKYTFDKVFQANVNKFSYIFIYEYYIFRYKLRIK